MSQAETALQKYDQPVVELTVFFFFVVMMCGGAHARVCRRGPTLFCFALKAEKMECLPPSCPQYRG